MLSWVHEPRIAGGQEMTYGRSLERHLKYFGLMDDGGKAITFSAGWSSSRKRLATMGNYSCGHLGTTPPELHQSRRGQSERFLACWRGVPRRLNNGVLSWMQKQTQKHLNFGLVSK
jgi:hypothetical protein